MQLLEADKPAFKQWLLPKLANRSDAEPEVLADYVAELFGGPGPQEQIKRNSSEQLSDFLGDYTPTFVDDVAAAIENKSWAAKPPATAPTAPKAFAGKRAFAPEAPVFVPRSQAVESASSPSSATSIPTGPRADRLHIPTGPATHGWYNQSKKRKHHDQDRNRSRNNGNEYVAGNPAGERPYKQVARRGGGGGGDGGRSGATGMASSLSSNAAPFAPFAAQPPASLPPLPPMDPSNPFSLMATMSTLLGQVYSGQASDTPKINCPDYENKGICKLGRLCPYNHGDAMVVPADPQYDPNMSSLAMPQSRSLQSTNRYQRHGPARAPFSQAGFSRGADTVVVEPIPEDYFTGQHVRDFFSQFGPIVDVQMHGYKRLAIVKFANHPAAQRAYDSPKVIFDNRFVKVHWHKPGKDAATQPQAPGNVPEIYSEDEEMIDLEEVKKKQAQIQAQWQEKRKKAEEVNARYHLLDAQARAKEEAAAELNLRIQAAERAKGVEKIKEKEQQVPASDLSKLQSEAEGLFASQGRYTNGQGSPSRGGYQGRRGGYRGRGGPRGGRGGVVRLDNRPRRLAVARVGSGSDKELALKQYLLNAKGCNGVQPHAERADTLVVGFEQRFQAEMFLSEALRIANVNSTDLSWIPNDVVAVQQSTEDDEPVEPKDELDEEMPDEQMEPNMELDFDVADDKDQWL